MRAELIGENRYSQAGLLAEAKRAGFKANKALLDRWVTLGLLDHAEPTGRGYKGGVLRTWPETQRQLWLTLLDKHRTVDSPRALANIPTAVWLIWGEAWAPLRQIRRALETYSEVRKPALRHDYPAAARKLVRDFARPGADPHAKAALADAIVLSARERVFHEEEIARLLLEVVGPADPGAQTDGPRVLAILRAQWAARARFDALTDGHFLWARAVSLYAQADYARVWPTLASDPRFGKIHEPFDLDDLANRACQDLLLVLGMALTTPPGPNTPEPLQLQPWLEGRGHVTTDVELQRSPLWLPRGQVRGGLSIHAQVTIDPPTVA